jgi:hypothetical protein
MDLWYCQRNIPALDSNRSATAYAVTYDDTVTAAGSGNFIDSGLQFFTKQVGAVVKAAFQKFGADLRSQFLGSVFDIERQHCTGDHVWGFIFQRFLHKIESKAPI